MTGVQTCALPILADVPRIGTLDFFGLTHVQEGRIRQALKAKEGDPLPASKGDAEERIDAISGIVASHLEAVCCDGDKMILYVGVEERGAGHFDIREAPEGDVMLPAEIVSTYRDFLEAVEAATRLAFDEGMQLEARLFEECRRSTQSKAMIHAFFGERTVSKVPDIPADTKTYAIQRAAIVGAGTMGGGIAMCFADAGIPVTIKETLQAALDRGLNTIRSNYARTVSSGRITQAAMDERMARITGQLD